MRTRTMILVSTILLAAVACAPGCTTTPGAEELPEARPGEPEPEGPIVLMAPPPEDAATPEAPPPIGDYAPLEYKGVRGGRIAIDVRGRPEDVLAMLLDFEHAAGNRAWAKSYRTLAREGAVTRARWDFEGEAGINPSVVLEFTERREGEKVVLKYRLREKEFGLAAFFGAYEATPIAGSTPPMSRFVETVFIDSGTWLANASQEEIEQGLREDARLVILWMEARVPAP